jgi:hypothetical protein
VVVEEGTSRLVVRGRGIAAPALPYALIHRSAWNRYSQKLVYRILHSPGLTLSESHILGDLLTPIRVSL